MAQLKVKQIKSEIGGKQNQRDSLRSLGLKRIGDVVVKDRGIAHSRTSNPLSAIACLTCPTVNVPS